MKTQVLPSRFREQFLFLAIALLWFLWSLPPASAQTGGPYPPVVLPPQPTGIALVHSHGQTFIRWTEVAGLQNASYRIYRSTNPITNVGGMTPIGRVWEDSAEFYADRIWQSGTCSVFSPRYVQRLYVPVQPSPTDICNPSVYPAGPAQIVPSGTGLFVWTLRVGTDPLGSPTHYAVTTVDANDVENPNCTAGVNTGSINESYCDPMPIEVTHAVPAAPSNAHVYIQYMDLHDWNETFHAPNATNCWWGEDPSLPKIKNAIQYAYAYTVMEPASVLDCCDPNPPSCDRWPVILDLHSRFSNRNPPDYNRPAGCAVRIAPIDTSNTWWFGFAREMDYRQPTALSCPYDCGPINPGCNGCSPDDVDNNLDPPANWIPTGFEEEVVNYTEFRLLRMIYDLFRDSYFNGRVDPDRVYVQGHSMGGSGTLSLALRYPDVFAAAAASKPMTDFGAYVDLASLNDYREELMVRWGMRPLPGAPGLPVAIIGPGDWAAHLAGHNGTSVWQWQNHLLQLQVRMTEDMVPWGMVHGINDTTIPYPSQARDAYVSPVPGGTSFAEAKRAWGGRLNCGGHGSQVYAGLPRSLHDPNQILPFWSYGVIQNESVPGFSNLSPGLPTPPSSNCCPSSCVPAAPLDYYRNIEWSSSWNPWDGAPIDTYSPTGSSWQISARLTSGAPATADVSPRRVQNFPTTGGTYRWTTHNLLTGVINGPNPLPLVPGEVLTVPSVPLNTTGTRVLITSP